MPSNEAPRRPPTLNHEPEMCRYARDNAGLGLAEAARRIGKSPQLLADIEAGRRNATPAVLKAMAQAYNCPRVGLERKRWSA
jgi:transcriptional regulator with XRE-family HTH domain